MFNNEFHIVRIFLQHLPEDGLKPRAVGSLVIIESNDGDRGVLRAFKWQARHVNLMNDLKQNDLESLLRITCDGQHTWSG